MLYLDARLAADYPTVEIRVADACTERRRRDAGRRAVPRPGRDRRRRPSTLIRCAATCCAQRTGEPPATGWPARSCTRSPGSWSTPGRPSAALVHHVAAALDAAGDRALVDAAVDRIWTVGGGARRQRQAYERTGSLAGVVADVVARTADRPRRPREGARRARQVRRHPDGRRGGRGDRPRLGPARPRRPPRPGADGRRRPGLPRRAARRSGRRAPRGHRARAVRRGRAGGRAPRRRAGLRRVGAGLRAAPHRRKARRGGVDVRRRAAGRGGDRDAARPRSSSGWAAAAPTTGERARSARWAPPPTSRSTPGRPACRCHHRRPGPAAHARRRRASRRRQRRRQPPDRAVRRHQDLRTPEGPRRRPLLAVDGLLEAFAAATDRRTSLEPGAGAAGGLGFALLALGRPGSRASTWSWPPSTCRPARGRPTSS